MALADEALLPGLLHGLVVLAEAHIGLYSTILVQLQGIQTGPVQVGAFGGRSVEDGRGGGGGLGGAGCAGNTVIGRRLKSALLKCRR